MAYISAAVEYGLHCLLFLVGREDGAAEPSSRDLAELQGVPVEYAAKIFTRLQKAGIVHAREGVKGGLRLARDPADISVHDVVVAIDGEQRLFDCREIRERCAVFDQDRPAWATAGLCGIHMLMLRAEEGLRDVLRATSLRDLADGFGRKAPASFHEDVSRWLSERAEARGAERKTQRKITP